MKGRNQRLKNGCDLADMRIAILKIFNSIFELLIASLNSLEAFSEMDKLLLNWCKNPCHCCSKPCRLFPWMVRHVSSEQEHYHQGSLEKALVFSICKARQWAKYTSWVSLIASTTSITVGGMVGAAAGYLTTFFNSGLN
jgi:hypothetical protein